MKRLRWICGVLVLVIGYNAALGILAYWQRRDVLNASLREAVVMADVLADDVEASLDRMDLILSGVGEVLRAYPATQDLHDPYAHRLLIRRHASSPMLRALFLVGPDGKLRNSSSTPNIAPIDVSDRNYFKIHTQANRDGLFIGPVIKDRLDGQWLIPVSNALLDPYGGLTMVVGGAMIPDSIEQMIRSHRLPEGFRVVVALGDGSLIGCLGFSSCYGEGGLRIGEGVSAQNRHSGIKVRYLPGEPGVGAFVRSKQYGIAIAIQADNATLLQPWQAKLKLVLALAVIGTTGLIAGAVVLYRQRRYRRLAILELERANASLESKVAERVREIAENEERLRSFIMAARDAVIIIDQNGLIGEFNPSATELFGYEVDEVCGKSVNMLMPPSYAAEHDGHLRKGKSSGQRAIGRGREMIGQRKNGTQFPIELTVGTHSMGGSSVHVGVIRDITERKANEDTLRRLANTDGLTGVSNRRSFFEEGRLLCALAERHNRALAILMIDADHFKAINDTHGHHLGDVVLQALAQAVLGVLRATDLFGRLGGEEFAVLLPETDPAGAEDLAWKVIEAVRNVSVPLPDGSALKFTISIGIACRGNGISSLEEVLKEADKALYVAKQDGRNRAVRIA